MTQTSSPATDSAGSPPGGGGSGDAVGLAAGGPAAALAEVRQAGSGVRHESRAILVIWRRETIRFISDRGRIVSSMLQPLLFLFVLGSGLSRVVPHTGGGVDYRTFLFPGVIAISVLFTAVFSGISIVWDREFGFLREMLVAPVRRSSIVIGKCLGGASTASLQGVVLLALAGLVHVPYSPTLLLALLLLMFLTAFAVTALGLVLAARVKTIQSAMPLVQMAIGPMMFVSGALYRTGSLPTWLRVLVHVNPLTYAVDAMRTVVFNHLRLDPALRHVLDPGISWGGWRVGIWTDAGLVVAIGALLLTAACVLFSRAE